jgi:hypothetical protein
MTTSTPNKPLNYHTARAKGTKLLVLMRSPTLPHPSTFTSSDISKWGYTQTHHATDTTLPTYTDLLTSLSTTSTIRSDADPFGSNIAVTYKHSGTVTVDGTLYPATNAYFSSIINHEAGLIIASNNLSPSAILPHNPSAPLPLLKHWSDIAYLQYTSLSPSPSPPLKYILRANIHNSSTLILMTRILGIDNSPRYLGRGLHPRMQWPGRSFKIDSWDAQALLGSPNGGGVGRLAVGLGCECVERVVVFF